MVSEINMPDVSKGATLGHIYKWIYNGGSYGRVPSIGDLIDKGYLSLLQGSLIYWDTTNGDLRASSNFKAQVQEANSAAVLASGTIISHLVTPPTIALSTGSSAVVAQNYHRRVARVPYTLAGGVLANLTLVDGVATYYAVIDSILVKPDDAVAAFLMTFECPAATAIESCELALVAQTINTQLKDYVVHGDLTADASDGDPIVVDLSGGAGVESGTIIVTYHYET